MKILLDNVNVNSSSGPNSFGRRLRHELKKRGHEVEINVKDPDVQLSFITSQQKITKMVLRLDGIYFNSAQDWQALNEPLKRSFAMADGVVYQSSFNQMLTEKYFGKHVNSKVINNGTCLEAISKIPVLDHPILNNFSEVWSCASSWRPHKRLKENVRYFLEMAPVDAVLVVAGENPDYKVQHPRIMFAGQLSWEQCISLYKRSKRFIHLAFLDHCPNVVVDARSSGCELIVASSGGTREIAGSTATVVKDIEWDMNPIELYSPPLLDFSKTFLNDYKNSTDIADVAARYERFLESI